MDPQQASTVFTARPFGAFSLAFLFLASAAQFFIYICDAAATYFNVPFDSLIKAHELQGLVDTAVMFANMQTDPLYFLWTCLYFAKLDFFKDLQSSKSLLDFLREHVLPVRIQLPQNYRDILDSCLADTPEANPGFAQPAMSAATSTGIGSAGTPAQGLGFQQQPPPVDIQTPGRPRAFGQPPNPTAASAPAAPTGPAAQPLTSALSPAAPTFVPASAQAQVTAGPSAPASALQADPSPVSSTPLSFGSLAPLLDTPTGCTGEVSTFNLFGLPHNMATPVFPLPSFPTWSAPAYVAPRAAGTSAALSLPSWTFPMNPAPRAVPEAISSAFTSPFAAPLVAQPTSLNQVLQTLSGSTVPTASATPAVFHITPLQSQTLPKFAGKLTDKIPDLVSWFRKLTQLARSTARPLLEVLDFHVQGEAQHVVEQMHRTQITDDSIVTSVFFQHYGYLYKHHSRDAFKKLFYGHAPLKLTKPMRMHDYIMQYRNLIAEAAVKPEDLVPGTTTSRNLCDRFCLGMPSVIARELKGDPQQDHEPYDDLSRLYSAALKSFEKHEHNPKLYQFEDTRDVPSSAPQKEKKHKRDDDDNSPPPSSSKRNKTQKTPTPAPAQDKPSQKTSYVQNWSKSRPSSRPASQKSGSSKSYPDVLKKAWDAHYHWKQQSQQPDWKPKPVPALHAAPALDEPYPRNTQRAKLKPADIPGNVIKHVTGSTRLNKHRHSCVFCLGAYQDFGVGPSDHWVDCEHRPF